jgi:hypothetical protein
MALSHQADLLGSGGRFLINTVLDEASAPITLIQN